MDILILLSVFLPERQGKTLNARKFGGCLRMELGMVCGMCVCVWGGEEEDWGPRNG